MKTIAQLFASWNQDIKPLVIAQYGANDTCALSESWNDLTDAECKEGEITDLIYHYCPAWDDEMPDDDGEFLLEKLQVEIQCTRIMRRTDVTGDWGNDASHWNCFIRRVGFGAEVKEGFSIEYSMGSAHRGSPELADVFSSLLMDSASVDQSFEDWCDELGFDSDSRSAERSYNACRDTAKKLETMFTKGELDDLREVFADR